MLLNRALAANADAENVDMTDPGGGMVLRLPGNAIGGKTP
jgi:hypothetical protein